MINRMLSNHENHVIMSTYRKRMSGLCSSPSLTKFSTPSSGNWIGDITKTSTFPVLSASLASLGTCFVTVSHVGLTRRSASKEKTSVSRAAPLAMRMQSTMSIFVSE